jgi:hypothetical protein
MVYLIELERIEDAKYKKYNSSKIIILYRFKSLQLFCSPKRVARNLFDFLLSFLNFISDNNIPKISIGKLIMIKCKKHYLLYCHGFLQNFLSLIKILINFIGYIISFLFTIIRVMPEFFIEL